MHGTIEKKKAIDPSHYADKKIEPIEVIEAWSLGFKLGNAVKYVARCEETGTRRDDLIKAANYCFREATGRWLPKEVLSGCSKGLDRLSRGEEARVPGKSRNSKKTVPASRRGSARVRQPAT